MEMPGMNSGSQDNLMRPINEHTQGRSCAKDEQTIKELEMKTVSKQIDHSQQTPMGIPTKPLRKDNTMDTELSSTQQSFLDGLSPLRKARMNKVFALLDGPDELVDPFREDTDIDFNVINDRTLEGLCRLDGITREQGWQAYDDLIQSGLARYLWDQGHPRIVLTEAGEKLLPQMVEEVFGEVNLR